MGLILTSIMTKEVAHSNSLHMATTNKDRDVDMKDLNKNTGKNKIYGYDLLTAEFDEVMYPLSWWEKIRIQTGEPLDWGIYLACFVPSL